MTSRKKRLAIIGAGPSGLITLKYALDRLPDWDIDCFEKQDDYNGAWGKTHPKFVSTSTKYTTQFACFQKFDLNLRKNQNEAEEFFRADEYGHYLNEFVQEFQLAPVVRLQHNVLSVEFDSDSKDGLAWIVRVEDLPSQQTTTERFTHVVIACGLANKIRPIHSSLGAAITTDDTESITGKTVVVCGGGESAVDLAERLCQPERKNRVYLSLRSGVRVSPRYHPIKNIPSDFLRTRLMLSIHEDIRNFVGGSFVEFRIRYDRLLSRLFPSREQQSLSPKAVRSRRAKWNLRINSRAKGKLFNMFHNKSDDFLTSIAEQRLHVLGPAVDSSHQQYASFNSTEQIDLQADLVVNATGYQSNLAELTGDAVRLDEFYLGIMHKVHPTLYCVGYARPIIGNIPTVAEMQARYVVGMLAGEYTRSADLLNLHYQERELLAERYPAINIDQVYPVDMIPYCDRLARAMDCYPKLGEFGSWRKWLSFWLSPATTNQYRKEEVGLTKTPVFAPRVIVLLLLLVKLADLPYKLCKAALASNQRSVDDKV